MKEQKTIAYDSPEAASIKTVTGWVSSNGRFWGDDEHMARYDGSTHQRCKGGCGELVANRGSMFCRACRENHQVQKYDAMPKQEWDGQVFLYSDSHDTYFDDYSTIVDYMREHDLTTVDDLRLIICEPNMAREIDGNEHFVDDLPEDGEISSELQAAFDALNAAINKEPPLSWSPGNVAAIVVVDPADLAEAA